MVLPSISCVTEEEFSEGILSIFLHIEKTSFSLCDSFKTGLPRLSWCESGWGMNDFIVVSSHFNFSKCIIIRME